MPKQRKLKFLPVIGRPTKSRGKAMDDEAFRLALLGLLNIEICEFFGITEETFYQWKKIHPTLSESIARGRQPADARVAEALYQRALGYSHPAEEIHVLKNGTVVRVDTYKHYPPDTNANAFWMRNRAKRDWKQNRDDGADGGEVKITVVNSWAGDPVAPDSVKAKVDA